MKNYKYIFFFLLIFNKHFSQTTPNSKQEAVKLYEIAREDFYNLKNKESVKNAEKILIYSLNKQEFTLAAKTYNLLGLNFEQFTDYNKAILYYKKGIECAKKANNSDILGWLYNNIGGVYSYNGIDLNKGTYYFKEAFKHTKNLKGNGDFLVAGLNIGANLIELKKYEEGKKYLDEVKTRVDNSNEYDIAVSLYSSYAAYYDEYENNFPKTENAFLKAINVGKKDNAPALKMNLLDVYKAFSDFYEKHNKLDKSVVDMQIKITV